MKGRRFVRRLNIDGDGQGDLIGHGGEHRAVLVYQMEAYRHWAAQMRRDDFTFGQFGENFTIDGLPAMSVHRRSLPHPGHRGTGTHDGERGQCAAYLPGHPRDKLQRALRIPALSSGWQDSFRALLRGAQADSERGNAGLAPASGPRPAWSGFQRVHIADKHRESDDVVSLAFAPPDTASLPLPRPGQFIVARRRPELAGAPLLRSYSLSGMPSGSVYRIAVKREPQGIASAYLHDDVQIGDPLEVSAPRGNFIVHRGEGPVVLLSAGIGITPVLSILHALAATRSTRRIHLIYGARDAAHHPFAEETGLLLARLPNATAKVLYSRATASDRPGIDYDAHGRVTMAVLEELRVQRIADFFLCGPSGFLSDLRAGRRPLLAHRHQELRTRSFHVSPFGCWRKCDKVANGRIPA